MGCGDLCALSTRALDSYPDTSQVSGFFTADEETPGGVYRFSVARQRLLKEAFLSGSQRKNPYSHQGV
jgi:hypothetical protein